VYLALQMIVDHDLHAPHLQDQLCVLIHSRKPQIKTVQDSNRKENCPGKQEPPHGMRKTSEYVREPCNQAGNTKK
jgi:hypothetical protein